MDADYDEYLQHFLEEDDRRYEDEIFERICEENGRYRIKNK